MHKALRVSLPVLLSVLAFGASAPLAFAATLNVVGNQPANAAAFSAVTKTADRLVTLQAPNGSWDWTVTGATTYSGTTYLNVAGVTAEGLLSAYAVTGKQSYLVAAKNAGDYIISQIDASSPKKINAYSVLFLQKLSTALNDASYSAKAAEYWNTLYSATSTTACAAGCIDSAGLFAGQKAGRPYGYPNGVYLWDLAPYVEYAKLTNDTVHAQELESAIVAEAATSTYVSSVGSYDLGLASALKAAALVGDSANTSLLLSKITSTDDSYGLATDGKIQTTAYMVRAFKLAADSRADASANYLNTGVIPTGGWLDTADPSGALVPTEYAEVDSEAITALVALLPSGIQYYSVQDAVTAAVDGDTVALGSDATTTAQITLRKAITIDGNGHTLYAPFAKTDTSNNAAIGILHSGVTIKNLVEDGTNSSGYRHGINIFEATSTVSLDNVTVKNNAAAGVTINGSTVTIHNITTAHNGWGGINADQAADAPDPTSVTITGTSSHAESLAMWVDDVSKAVTVNDFAHQYSSQPYVHGVSITGALYGLNSVVVGDETQLRAALANAFISKITLSANITLAAELDIARSVIIDGAGHTIGASFSNASVIQIGSNNVTLKNLIEDGSGTTKNRGINIYKVTGILLDHVTASNNYKNGIVVNGSTVTVNNIVTKGNGWEGIDIDMGSGVTTLASLTVNGTSVHKETKAAIRIDNTSKVPTPTMIDTNEQYVASTTATLTDYYLKSKNDKTEVAEHHEGKSDDVTVEVDIPENSIVKGDSDWDGTIAPPTAKKVSVVISGFNTNVTAAIAVGSNDSDLSFDRAVKLTFVGQAGKLVGFYNHHGVFSEISATCGGNDQATGDALAAGTACKVDSGSDLVVWTKHFSTFATYTQTAIVYGSSSGGSVNSSNNGSIGYSASAGSVAASATPAVPATPAARGKVLGAEAYNFAKDLRMGSKGADVTELQKFLMAQGHALPDGATGYFGKQTKAAVLAFQKARGIAQVGNVGPLTRGELNKGSTAPTTSSTTTTPAAPVAGKSNLSATQANAILGLLQSFNADASVIAQVKAALGQ